MRSLESLPTSVATWGVAADLFKALQLSLHAADRVSANWAELEARDEEIARLK